MKYLLTSLVLTLATLLPAQSSISIDLTSGIIKSNVKTTAPADADKAEAFVWSKLKTFFSKDAIPAKANSISTLNSTKFQIVYTGGRYTLTVDGIEEISGTTVAAMRTAAAVAAFKKLYGKTPS